MSKIKVMTIFGVRPEAIKMAPLVLELGRHPEHIESVVCVTAQHRELLDQVLEVFKITPDYDLDVMKDRQTLNEILAANTGKPLDVIQLDTERDHFKSAFEAQAYGLVDQVLERRPEESIQPV